VEQMLRGGYSTTQILHAAVRSGVVDALSEGPADAQTLARRISGDDSAVLRLLRGIVVLGLATVDGDGRFVAAPDLALLRSDEPQSLRDAALFLGGSAYRAWAELDAAVTAGESPFERALGMGLWEYTAANPEEGAAFNGAMRGMSHVVERSLADSLAVDDGCVVDVGGGRGHLVAALLERNDAAHGIVFDQQHLEPEATSLLAARGLAERCRFVGGSFFHPLPAGDVYLMKWIIHDWADDDCRVILGRCRDAMAADGRLVIVERPLPELQDIASDIDAARPAVLADLQMLAMSGPGGFQERTDAQYEALLAESGFSLRERVPLAASFVAFVSSPMRGSGRPRPDADER
jgi:hypothetical protein